MRNKLIGIASVILAGILLFSSCERRYRQDVLMLYPSWAEGIAITNLASYMLEKEGYRIVMKRIEPGPIFASLWRGDADVCMDAWLPNTHESYWERYGDKLEILGTVFDDGITGLVVPTYVDINSIEELNDHVDQFEGKIYGIASGAGIHRNTLKAIETYNLNYDQLTSSETSMVTALKKAVKREEWIIITGWKPHFIWSDFDLKKLEDPKGVYPKDEITIVSRPGFAEDKPEIAHFFSKFNLEEKMLNELIEMVGEDKDPMVGVEKFYTKYESHLKTFFED